ncbi:MAG: helix-turn-helix domain-containing protein [bacterium]
MGGLLRSPVQLKLKLELPLEDTLDVFTAARIARVSTWTIRRWCEQGLFPCYKLVGQWRVERAPFYAWIHSRRITPAE